MSLVERVAAVRDPVEKVIAKALAEAGIAFVTEQEGAPNDLDFYLPDFGVHIEVKRFHAARIAAQMERAPNVIAIQGMEAAEFFAAVLRPRAEQGALQPAGEDAITRADTRVHRTGAR